MFSFNKDHCKSIDFTNEEVEQQLERLVSMGKQYPNDPLLGVREYFSELKNKYGSGHALAFIEGLIKKV